MHDGAQWRLAFEHQLDAPPDASARAALSRYAIAAQLLRDGSCQSSFRRGELFRKKFAYVLGDVDGGARTVEQLLNAMDEACAALGFDCLDLIDDDDAQEDER